jgi:hypothetical protein
LDDLGIESVAALGDDGVQILQCFEILIGEGFIEQRPQMLGGLELGTIGRQIDQEDAIRDREPGRTVPASIVEHEEDDAFVPGSGLTCEGGKQLGKERLVDSVRQIPNGLSGCGRHKRSDVEPLVAVVAERDRALADWRPDPAADRLQPEAMLVDRPDLDR